MACAQNLSTKFFIYFLSLLLFIMVLVQAKDKNLRPFLSDASGYQEAAREAIRLKGDTWADLYLPTKVSPSSPCGQALHTMMQALHNSSLWAAIMVDSWGKSADGLALGNTKVIGVYDECVGAASPDGNVRGKYCQVFTSKISGEGGGEGEGEGAPPKTPLPNGHSIPGVPWLPPLPGRGGVEAGRGGRTIIASTGTTTTNYGTCMPHFCTKDELTESLNSHLIWHSSLAFVMCPDEEPSRQFTDADAGFVGVVTLLTSLAICASVVDIFLSYTQNDTLRKGVLRYLLVFSAYTNLAKMMHLQVKPQPSTITCLHGMRVLAMTWVVYCHQHMMSMYTANLLDIGKWTTGFLQQIVLNGYLSVDTFFFISGLLVSYSLLRQDSAKRPFNAVLYVVHRLIRLLPPLCLVLGFSATVARFCTSGPYALVWAGYWQKVCQKFWWRDAVFVNNFLYEDGDCMSQAWYLAVDTQLYLVAPILVLPLVYWKERGKAWLYLVTIASALTPGLIILLNNYPPLYLIYGPEGVADFGKYVNLTPWCRAGPWLAGVWLGYLLHTHEGRWGKLSWLTVTVGWTLAAVTGVLVVFGMASYNTLVDPFPYEAVTQFVYGGFHKLAFGFALAWLVFACHCGYGGLVNDFLSHPVWQPLSRLTYTIYLLALQVQFLLAYSLRAVTYYSFVNKIIETVGTLVITLPLAMWLSLVTESPVLGLERLILRPAGAHSAKREGREFQSPVKQVQPQGEVSEVSSTSSNSHEDEKHGKEAARGSMIGKQQLEGEKVAVTSL